jgi:uncharacterized glyoxalase superfamily protein PhnB
VSTCEQVIPLLVYRDLEAAHDFLVRAFGFTPGGVVHDVDGQPVHGEITFGGTTIWLHRATAEHGVDSPAGGAMTAAGLVVLVDDVDAHCANARAAGADVDEPVDQPYGQREYEARDLEGHRWWFATPTAA